VREQRACFFICGGIQVAGLSERSVAVAAVMLRHYKRECSNR